MNNTACLRPFIRRRFCARSPPEGGARGGLEHRVLERCLWANGRRQRRAHEVRSSSSADGRHRPRPCGRARRLHSLHRFEHFRGKDVRAEEPRLPREASRRPASRRTAAPARRPKWNRDGRRPRCAGSPPRGGLRTRRSAHGRPQRCAQERCTCLRARGLCRRCSEATRARCVRLINERTGSIRAHRLPEGWPKVPNGASTRGSSGQRAPMASTSHCASPASSSRRAHARSAASC